MEELEKLNIIAFTHRNLQLDTVGKLVVDSEESPVRLQELKEHFGWAEVMMIGTCNRVELVYAGGEEAVAVNGAVVSDKIPVAEILKRLYPMLSKEELWLFTENALVYTELSALEHLMKVSSSLDSLVVGEKEILLQVRQSYEAAKEKKLTGDFLRLVMNRVVKTAKEVYTHTKIAEKPVSVVSIAYRLLKSLKTAPDARMLIIGAGQTNKLFSKYLRKHGSTNFTVFNRTLTKAAALSAELGGMARPLEELGYYDGGFDVIITCTGAARPIITPEIYHSLLKGETGEKIMVDLSLPSDKSDELRD